MGILDLRRITLFLLEREDGVLLRCVLLHLQLLVASPEFLRAADLLHQLGQIFWGLGPERWKFTQCARAHVCACVCACARVRAHVDRWICVSVCVRTFEGGGGSF